MPATNRKPHAWLAFGLSLLAHLPFLSRGYGKEFDAWSNALNAKTIWETGVYEVSRLPGHPVYELLLSTLWPINHSYFFFNLLSAIATSFAVFLLYRIAEKMQVNNALTLALSFAAIPVFFIAGNYTIDYNFSLLFILWSFYSLLHQRLVLAGILLGIATGFRISSLGFLLPFSIMFFKLWKPAQHLKFWLTGAIMSLLVFLPPLLRYGTGFLDFHKPPFPSLANILYKMSIGIWGIPLLLALALCLVIFLMKKQKMAWHSSLSRQHFIGATVLILIMQLAVFLRLPFKSEFFIPALPFLWLLLFTLLRKGQARLILGAAVLSLFFFGFDYYQSYRGATPGKLAVEFKAGGKQIFLDPLQGPVLIDLSKRSNKSAFISEVIHSLESKPEKVWLIAGWYWPELQLKAPPKKHYYDHYSTAAEIDSALEAGYELYYLPELAEVNALVHGHYLADSLGKPLLAP